MITNRNIKAYINYLHQIKTGSLASDELLLKWGSLSENEIRFQLLRLYKHWDLDETQAKIHEQNFISFNKPILNQTIAQTKQEVSYLKVADKSNTLKIVLVSIFVGLGIGAVIYYLMNSNSSKITQANELQQMPQPSSAIKTEPDKNDSSMQIEQQNPVRIKDTLMVKDTTENTDSFAIMDIHKRELNESDRENFKAIYSLLDAEVKQDFSEVASFFSPQLRQYWDIMQPTYEILESRYTAIWNKIENPQNKNLKVYKLGPNKYRLTGIFDYWSKSQMEAKSVPINIIYEFDEKGKIVYANKGQ